MRLTHARVVVVLVVVASACTIGLSGCCPTYGKVYVSHPQVFTRERLVAAREKELQFLNNSLSAQVQSTFSGAEDVRTLSAFQDSLGVTVSPTAGANVANASAPTLSDVSKMQLASPDSLVLAKNLSVSSVDHFNDVMAYRDAVNAVIREKELDDTHDRDGKTLYTLKFDTALIPGDNSTRAAMVKVQIEQSGLSKKDISEIYKLWLQDLEARRNEEDRAITSRFYRGQITAADEGLLFYLKAGADDFCASVTDKIRGSNREGTTNSTTTKDLECTIEWIRKAEELTANLLTLSPQCRQEELNKIMSHCEPLQTPASEVKSQPSGAQKASPAGTTATNMQPTNTCGIVWDNKDLLLTGMTIALNAKYCSDFAGLASIEYNIDEIVHGDTLAFGYIAAYSTSLDSTSKWWSRSTWRGTEKHDGEVQFSNVLSDWASQVYVDSIDPQVYAQNISDVSSQTKLLELALTLNAAVAKPASLSNTAKYIHESQTLLQAIKRQALAIGFCSGSEFGWLLGPPFAIKKEKAVFSQTPTRQSFSVSIVVPAWQKDLKLKATQCWIDENGDEVRKTNMPPMEPVILPRDMDALTSAIQRRTARLAPTIYLAAQALEVATNRDQTLLIRGRELWRNPAVIVGSTPADAVDLLPDMRGLIAHFKSIPSTYGDVADLTVVTSYGADALEKSVRIISPSKSATNQPLAKLTNSFAVNGGQPLTFTLTSMPAGYDGFSIKLSTKETPGKWLNLGENEYKLSSNHTFVSIPIVVNPAPIPPAPILYTVELGLRYRPSDFPTTLMPGTNQPSFVYFPVKDQEKPIVAAVVLNYSAAGPLPPAITVGPVTSVTKQQLYQAYPGLEKCIADGKATLSLLEKVTKRKSQALTVKDAGGTGWTVSTSLPPGDLPNATYDSFTMEYQTPDGKSASIEMLGGPVTVIGH